MVRIGKFNRLLVKGKHVYGFHLDGGRAGDILLRGKSAAEKYQQGDEVNVFVYVDREQRLVATTKKPSAMVGEFAYLRVLATTTAGAFMDWGLESDLFVPKSEQQDNMGTGKSYVVFIFLSEKNNSITASSKLEKFLDLYPPVYEEGQEVDLLVFAKTDMGYSAVVNSAHTGMIYQNEIFQQLTVGRRLKGYIKKVREDHKIDLRLQQTGYQRVDDVAQTILATIMGNGGMVALSDKSPPEEIYATFGVSKKVFKKAIGALYRQKLIILETDGVKLAG